MLESPRIATAQDFARIFESEMGHFRQVALLAEKLFGAFEPLHGLGEEACEWLCCAAWMHDVGVTVDSRGHHKHSLRLILDAPLPEFTPREKRIVANIARYHRKALPKPTHEAYAALARDDQVTVCRMAALIRIADGLDRAHMEHVTDVAASQLAANAWQLAFSGPGDMELAHWGAERKADLFEVVYGVSLLFDFT